MTNNGQLGDCQAASAGGLIYGGAGSILDVRTPQYQPLECRILFELDWCAVQPRVVAVR